MINYNNGIWIIKTLIHQADTALYQAKNQGRDRIIVAQ